MRLKNQVRTKQPKIINAKSPTLLKMEFPIIDDQDDSNEKILIENFLEVRNRPNANGSDGSDGEMGIGEELEGLIDEIPFPNDDFSAPSVTNSISQYKKPSMFHKI